MIVSDYLACPLAIHSTGFRHHRGRGHRADRRRPATSSRGTSTSRSETSTIWRRSRCRWSRTTRRPPSIRYQAMCEVYDDILPVKKVGQDAHLVHALGLPDPLVGHPGGDDGPDRAAGPGPRRRGSHGRRLDGGAGPVRVDEPAVARLRQHAHRLRRLRLHRASCRAMRYDPDYVRPHNMWGCSNAQIFSEVSPEMHWEFALEHDVRWLERWGLTYYGCCEPLDSKIDILRRIPNLRKISISPWCDTDRAGRADRHRLRDEPQAQPAVLAEDTWHPGAGPRPAARVPGAGPGLPRRADHEGHLDRPLPAAAAVGVGRRSRWRSPRTTPPDRTDRLSHSAGVSRSSERPAPGQDSRLARTSSAMRSAEGMTASSSGGA